ncbi:uncharacterized protein PHACADRAFT_247861 [Phanerochaete carnosa HHB-10118-sp]|uniref:Uncharacterized protein n=1 Tax=Phanerochaete carnosa (strain HHB-10118-sp) TaxID=650164 RepID=K5VEC6_PHACS|nr:uncharacterized protein PHACADRAFT_247861 [Phanerochaete carnosa HHB-10118-sp]EKM61326.1 hypothetical protein PHACADRAFT_247861 [Phanerochaete carnosa HHB-10118-sp]
MQLLFGLLLPSTPAFVGEKRLHEASKAGSPPVELQSQTAVEVVKPSARFGLLLVGSSLAR